MPIHEEMTKTAQILEVFDRMRSWPGIVMLAEKCGTSRQNVQKVLLRYRKERYLRLRHASRGRRHDLGK